MLTTFILAEGLFVPPATATADRWDPPTPQQDHLVEGTAVPVEGRPADPAQEAALAGPAAVRWPRPGSATADVPAPAAPAADGARAPDRRPAMVALPGLPVRVGAAGEPGATAQDAPARQAADAPRRVRVEVLDPAAAREAAEVRLRVTRADGSTRAGEVGVEIDYSAFRHAFGGDWAARLRLLELPGCAATQVPGTGQCPAARPVPAGNDAGRGVLTADVTAAASTGAAAAAVAGTGLYALAAGPSGSTGDYAATPLSPSAEWQVGAQSGDFTWSQELRTPPSIGDPSPQLTLAYSAGGVDGRTASTNNQPGWAGEGFDLSPGGYIERRYKSCADDGVTPKNGERCWAGDNAVMVLGGKATELVLDTATKQWKPKNDDGSRVEKLTGAANGDDDGEYWKVTQTDGTQYLLGYNRLPGWSTGKQETASTWTAPVYGDDAGEPCHASTYAASWCQQAYRWNLDHVIDPHGGTMSYFYLKEVNHYGRNMKPADVTPYTASGYLQRIEYGQRAGQVYSKPAAGRVLFGVDERCLRTSTFDCAPAKLTKANAAHWPDVPADMLCGASGTCANHGAAFFTRKRLTTVTTEVLKDGAHTPVDTWTLTQTFPRPGDDMSPALWLESVQHTGRVGGSLTTPAVDFDGVEMPNRVDGLEGVAPMMKWRVRSVNNEGGGRLTVDYSKPDCTRSALPEPHANGRRCYPMYWSPEGATSPTRDWFHKYLTVRVLESDLTGGSPTVRTDYQHLDSPAWAYDDAELAPANRRTWSQWRGYERVRVVKGEAQDSRSATEHLFFRGMDGDKQPSGTRDVQVTDSEGVKIDDHWRLQGFERETIQLSGPGGTESSGTVNDPWLQGPNATDPGDQSYRVDIGAVRTRMTLSTGAIRRTESRHTYDAHGSLSRTDDLGDTATDADDRCVRNTYNRNPTAMIMNTVSRTETVSVDCATTPRRPADVLTDHRMSFDGGAYGDPPVRGDVTLNEDLKDYTDGRPEYTVSARSVYDAYGRKIEGYDGAGSKTTTAYLPAADAPAAQMTVTNPLGHTETTVIRPEWGSAAADVDVNGRRTELAYDPLGRLAKVWLPGRPTSQSPNQEFSYQIQKNTPSAVATKTLRNDGTYSVSYQIYDGLMRLRQEQRPAHEGGRLLSDTVYNTLGQVAKTNDSYANAESPSATLLGVADSAVPAQSVTEYDGLGRATAEILKVMGTEKWRTTTTTFPDRVDVDPPEGTTPTTALIDARGRTVGLRQYKGSAPTGDFDLTRYGFHANGSQESVTDAAGNVWRTFFDQRQRAVRVQDPDKGTTTYTFDDLDRPKTTTDARGRTLAFVYDAMGRRTAVHKDSPTGPKLASWTYDTLADGTPAKGMLTSSSRYHDGEAYTTRVDAFDAAYRATSSSHVIPQSEGELAGTYTFGSRYNMDGTRDSVTYPAAGGLAAETVRTTYTDMAAPRQTRSTLQMYVDNTWHTKHGEVLQERWGQEGAHVLHDNTYEEGTRRLIRTIVDRQSESEVRQADLNYAYDESGNIERIADTPPAANAASDTQCFAYDYLQRLSQAWTQANGCADAPATGTVGGATPYWTSYTHDLTGGRKSETRHALTAGQADTVSTYSYPEPGQPRPHALKQVSTEGPGGDRLDTYAYDESGNTIVRKLGSTEQRLEWDAEGHLEKVVEGGKTTSFVYDSEGNRLIRRDPAGTVLYLGSMEVRLNTGATAPQATRYYEHGDRPVAVRSDNGRLTWLVTDHHNTSQLAVDALSLEVTRRRMDPFGNQRGTAPASWPSERAFVGGTADPSTGMVHLGAREYLPSEGRFLSVDSVFDPSEPQKLQGYAYANNNPVSVVDPDGRDWFCPACWAAKHLWSQAKERARDIWRDHVARARRLYEEMRERLRRAAEEARRKAEEMRRKAEEARRKAEQARERARRAAQKAKQGIARNCRLLFDNCDPKRPVDKSGLGQPFGCSSFPDPARCVEHLKEIDSTIHKHVKLQIGFCSGPCVSLSYQQGVVQMSAGGAGVGPLGSAQWMTTGPEEGGPWSVGGCGVIAPAPVGPCITGGPKVDDKGEWTGVQGGFGVAAGAGLEVGGDHTIASWSKEDGLSSVPSPVPPSWQDPICKSWWGWYC
ncbi:RHS repeat-associated core domain-containing protein [Sphaerisporangium sp. TRM90804]|uniref:RHS repeat-associated core domain-containing protein n=1 Tax=Sphaerisporangium sp. TRM90804 TaxID=3031113 RepID=UPI00244B371B|nr:RHS repeat-associated core domain-containing protein [Sphaerisporangium sp. TRM90804]MDH2428505.1 RHS repeat-associated core domain-containing protein [Sphaerisporangium sp. TRM90804]